MEDFSTVGGADHVNIILSPGALVKDNYGHFVVDGSVQYIAAALKSGTGNQSYELSVPDNELATIHSATIYFSQGREALGSASLTAVAYG